MIKKFVLGLAISMIMPAEISAKEVTYDPLYGEIKDVALESNGEPVGTTVRATVKRTVIDNAAKKKLRMMQQKGKLYEAKKDIATVQTKNLPQEPENQKVNDKVLNNAKQRPLTLLEQYKQKLEEREKALEKTNNMTVEESRQKRIDRYNEAKEKRRTMSREDSRKQQLANRKNYKDRMEERRQIRQMPRAERHKLQKLRRQEEKLRRKEYLADKKRRKEMRKRNK